MQAAPGPCPVRSLGFELGGEQKVMVGKVSPSMSNQNPLSKINERKECIKKKYLQKGKANQKTDQA